jgi:hypothetical protein
MSAAKRISIAKLLAERGCTLIGPIPEERRAAIVAYTHNPDPSIAAWKEVRSVVINGIARKCTLWQAVAAIVPGATADTYLPDPFTVARAIRQALGE